MNIRRVIVISTVRVVNDRTGEVVTGFVCVGALAVASVVLCLLIEGDK
jgi:hypothetical protein